MIYCGGNSSVVVSKSKLLQKDDEKKSVLNTLIKEVVLSTIKELLISLTLSGVCCLFVAAPAIPGLIIFTVSVVAFNLLVRSIAAREAYQLYLVKQKKQKPSEIKRREDVLGLLNLITSYDFSILHTLTSNVLIHEAGHAVAALAVYQNPDPKISVFPFTGGETSYQYSPLSSLGKYLGISTSKALVSAAGTGFGVILGAALIGISHSLKKEHPRLSLYLLCSGIMSVAQHVLYALSALWEASPIAGHDFVSLWKYGIHPLISVICIIALPVFIKLALCGIDRLKQKFTPVACETAK